MPYYTRPDGCRLYYEVHGDTSAQPMLLLEGMGGDIPGWGRHLEGLAEEVRVVAHDFRGNGRSDKPDDSQTMGTFVGDTVGLLDHVGIWSAHVYGLSFGGMVAQELALSHPERVRSLVLGCTHAGANHAVKTNARAPKDRPWLALFSPDFAREHPEDVAEHQRVARQNLQPSHAARRQWEAMRDFASHDRLPQIRVPTLVVHGRDDQVIDPENGRVIAERIRRARLALLEGAGHVYHWERPEEATRIVLDFVREVSEER